MHKVINTNAHELVRDLNVDLTDLFRGNLDFDTDIAGGDFSAFWSVIDLGTRRELFIAVQQQNDGDVTLSYSVRDDEGEVDTARPQVTIVNPTPVLAYQVIKLGGDTFRSYGTL